MTPSLLSKKSLSPKIFSGRPGELDNFLLNVENLFALDKAHYPMDLDKTYYEAGHLKGQVANGAKIFISWSTRKRPFNKKAWWIGNPLGLLATTFKKI